MSEHSPSVCVACGAPVAAEHRFCGFCGLRVAPATSLTSEDPSLVGSDRTDSPIARLTERRICSIMFCDLVGFTTYAEGLDPEEVSDRLWDYANLARAVVREHGGYIEKFIGDAVMAVWGTPVASDNDAERAVAAAIELTQAVRLLEHDGAIAGLSARAGVVTRRVAADVRATDQALVAGDAVNTAARVQASGEADQVLVDETTYRQVRRAFELHEVGNRQLRGKDRSVRLWRATRPSSALHQSARRHPLSVPIVGRDVELQQLRSHLNVAVERRHARLVLVSGEPGVGKSRLVQEFTSGLSDGASPAVTYVTHCPSYGAGAASFALSRLVQKTCDIPDSVTPAAAAAKLNIVIAEHTDDEGVRRSFATGLGRLIGASTPDDDSDMAQEQLFSTLLSWLRLLSRSHPLIIVIEDLENADRSLLEFLDYSTERGRDCVAVFLGLARPELGEDNPDWFERHHHQEMRLRPLDESSMSTLLEALAPGIPPRAATVLSEAVRGNALFAVQTIESLVERNIVSEQGGHTQFARDFAVDDVPDNLQSLLSARLDRLPTTDRQLVALCAVLGDPFSEDAVGKLAGISSNEVRRIVVSLAARGILVKADRSATDTDRYSFTHGMVRQVAYDTLSRRERKRLHLAVAAQITGEDRQTHDRSNVVAQHYLDALEAIPDSPDAREIRRSAVVELDRAARLARGIGDERRAARTFARAAPLCDPPERAAALWEEATNSAISGSENEEAVAYADQARASYLAAGNRRSAARAQTYAGRAFRRWGRWRDARERFESALLVLNQDPDHDTVYTLGLLAALEVYEGTTEADARTSEAIALGERLNITGHFSAELLNVRGMWHSAHGHHFRAAACYREAARLAETVNGLTAQGNALINLAAEQLVFDSPAAPTTAQRANDIFRRRGDRKGLEMGVDTLVEAHVAAGDWDLAATELRLSVETDGMGDATWLAPTTCRLAALQGDTDAAHRSLARVVDLNSRELMPIVAFCLALIADAEGNDREALARARESIDLESAGMYVCDLRWRWPLAVRAAYRSGNDQAGRELLEFLDKHPSLGDTTVMRAERQLAEIRLIAASRSAPDLDVGLSYLTAVEALRSHSTPYHLAQGLLDYSAHLAMARRFADAAAALDEAEAIAVRLGALTVRDRARRARRDQLTMNDDADA